MKPIAWIDKNTGKPKMDGFIQTDYDIPLYTHPANLTDRIAELEKDLALKTRDRDVFKNFTLAYEERIAELEKCAEYYRDKYYFDSTAKTLTDEEIDSIAMSCEVGDRFDQVGDEIYTREFARKILRKAQEK